ncbi:MULTISPECIES: GNAT family N-acetyltransferase [unclassified Meiothermus]|uniref:GNAT family N-acetyltransferase n=1 Tax=unclassified Meiothermus TaxID=370471 RepID=UPI000D7CFEF7|nr:MULTISPECIES: GNAT family N-acetyltransferase [unclassified Meiothermus]PZA08440.1 GNAT family N-acetyltransferase [Meiothermus sp. Pnk-1]RYM37109.1 GNAT family N-acetyltransferase [Meiothermus sp. PNK-Is4]
MIVQELHDPQDFFPIEALQSRIWGDPEDVMPARSMMALVHEGGLLAAAYLQGEPVGFVFGFPTHHRQRHHSHMMGVLEEHRGSGAALLLKRFQRDWCLSRGYEQVVWTFDPLRGANARFNLCKLGVTWNEYIPNCYGPMGGINAGAPSDRAYAVWELRAERVYRRIYRPEPEVEAAGIPQVNTVRDEVPIQADLSLEHPRLLLQIPEDWGAILRTDPALANAWREHSRELFPHYFARGYRAVDFLRHPNRYLLERTP